MRPLVVGYAAILCACASTAPSRLTEPPSAPATASHVAMAAAGPAPGSFERITADTPKTTVEGATFIAPAGWSIAVRGAATVLEPPETDSHIALVDVHAKDADAAVAAAWVAYKPDAKWPLKISSPDPNKDGWTDIRVYRYQTSPDEKREVSARARHAGDVWTVAIYDMTDAVGEKRLGAVLGILGGLLPKGYVRESFAGKKANRLDDAHIAQLRGWVEMAMRELRVPGVAVGLVQDGKVVFAEGFGVRELGKKERPDADTLFMIASNTKAMTTLMLAKAVDEKKLTWETPVTSVLPTFKLGDAETTRQVQVRHLVCACTGVPRQDLEWKLQFKDLTPAGVVAMVGTMQPTSKFGELFQYSNLLASTGGFVGGHALYPKLELGAAYDEAMRTRVFEPLGMKETTFDAARAQKGNHASPHAPDIDGKSSKAITGYNVAQVPLRPSGGAWSSVRDVLAFVSGELAEGVAPSGKRYIGKEALLARRVAQVTINKDIAYGMGLFVESAYGTPVIWHNGGQIGFKSAMMWLPEHGVGAVVLTNSESGDDLSWFFRRKLFEVLFDGKPEADGAVAASAKELFDKLAADRKLLAAPADAAEVAKLAKRYASDALGEIVVSQVGSVTTFDFGEWKSEVASRKNPDGTTSFITIAPGVAGEFDFVVGTGSKRTLVMRDGQHEYVFTER